MGYKTNMKKFFILILGLSLTAASCDIFNFGGGTRGVFKSEDGGETFSAVNQQVRKGDIANLSIISMVFDPSNPNILYIGTSSGIFKSEDAAKTWKFMLSGISVGSLAIDRNAPTILYAAGIVGQNGKIIKSVDAGTSWVDIYTEPSKSNTVLSIAVSNSSSNTIIAGLNNGEVIKSTDSGRTWQATKDLENRVLDVEFGPGSTAYALTSIKGLYRSTDSGTNWELMTSSLTQDSLNPVSQGGAVSVTAFQKVAFDVRQPGVVYLATEQGLFRTVNDGKDWAFMALPLRNAALRVSAVAVDPTNSNTVFAAVASTLYKSVNGGLTWETRVLPTNAVIHNIVINPTSTNIIYTGLRTQ